MSEELDLKTNPKVKSIKLAIGTLVADCPNLQARLKKVKRDSHFIFCTISPNPKVKHPCFKTIKNKKVSVNLPYGQLPQKLQYAYCLRIVESDYLEFLSEDAFMFGTWELNKQGDVHFHFIIYDPKIINVSQLAIFRRDISNCPHVMQNTAKGKNDYMNNIVFVNDTLQHRIKYMDKDWELNKDIFDNYLWLNNQPYH